MYIYIIYIYICFVRIVCICTLSWLLMHVPVIIDASYIYRVYYKYQEPWNLTTRLYFYSWRKTLGAFMEAMSSYITRPMKTRMDVGLTTTTVRASKSYFVLHYKYFFRILVYIALFLQLFCRKNDDIHCHAKVHALEHRDAEVKINRVFQNVIGAHSPNCRPSKAQLQVNVLVMYFGQYWLFFTR